MYSSKRLHWEVIKLAITGSTIQYATRKKKSDTNKIQALERKLRTWQRELEESNFATKPEKQVIEIQKELAELYAKKTQGAMLRCAANWAEAAGKSTKYFLNLEKSKYNNKTLHRVQTEKGFITENEEEIMAELTKYYKELYAEFPKVEKYHSDYLSNLDILQLTKENIIMLESELTLKELGEALKQLKNGKAPGIDGIPCDLLKMFWGKLKYFMLELYREIIKEGKLHIMARQGLISLLEKLDRNPLLILNWRPITLLTADYKILAKVIALRLQVVLPELVHESQTGFMKGRNIGENIIKLQCLMEYVEKFRESGVIISFDFEKAFDKLRWNRLEQNLEAFGFQQEFIKLVQILYNDVYSAVLNNGKRGDFFQVFKGCRQGCPSSALIFLLNIEVLGLKIRSNVEIKGLEMFKIEIKAAQYADDIWVALFPTEKNIDRLLNEMHEFQEYSGMKINFEKSKAFKIGPCRYSDAKFITQRTIAWTQEPVKILGIWIHPDSQKLFQYNYFDTLKKCRVILKQWSTRKISWLGKITVINSLIASMFAYKLRTLPSPPKSFYGEFKHMITEFLWDGKVSKVRYDNIIQDYGDGGLKLIDLESKELALKARWPLLLANKEVRWFYGFLPLQDHRIWQANIVPEDIKLMQKAKNRSLLVGQIWLAWSKVQYSLPENIHQFISKPLWGNLLVKIAGKPVFDLKLVNSNIDMIFQLKHEIFPRIITYEEMIEVSGVNNISHLRFAGILSALPTVWKKDLIATPRLQVEESNFEKLAKQKNPSKLFYWELIGKKKTNTTVKLRWEVELGTQISEEYWQKIQMTMMSITNESKLRSFQYKIIQKKLTTNVLRNKYTEETDNKCELCKTEVETVIHLLCECKKVQKMWNLLNQWCKYHYNIVISLTNEVILFNVYSGKEKKLINSLILLLKRYIYITKCKKENMSFIAYMKLVSYICNIESYIAKKNNKWKIHEKKWKPFLQ